MLIFKTKNQKLKAINQTLYLLEKYHAVKPDNEQFKKQYRHLLALKQILQQKGKT